MKLSRIYLDTSVIGGCHDKEFAPWPNGLMKDFRLRNYIPVISDLTFEELVKAPKPVKQTLRRLCKTVLLPDFGLIAKTKSSNR